MDKITDLGVQVEHIPGGCTCLCQPIDVGIAKPLKNRVRERDELWRSSITDINEKLKPPTREMLAGWIIESLQSVDSTIVCNSWHHGQFSYFDVSGANNNNNNNNHEGQESEADEGQNEGQESDADE